MEQLISILETRRQHDSDGEASFIERFITPLNPTPMLGAKGQVIAYVVDVKRNGVLWSAHVDTMHRDKGTSEGVLTQEVWVSDDGMAFVTDKADCLGADDGAGMWLMFNMIERGVAGTYIFHRGEEIGCWGSGEMATHHRAWLAEFTHAIAFDRRGTTSIITHQRGERACSDALGNQLADLFGLGYVLDPTGVYTDTAEYMDIIPECVNVSIGYDSEHSHHESLDTNHCLALRDAICALDWDSITLVAERDPTKREYRTYPNYPSYGGFNSWQTARGHMPSKIDRYEIPSAERLQTSSTRSIAEWVAEADPEDVAMLLQDLADQLEEATYALSDAYDDYDYGNDNLKVGMM
jgi:hypothetical protein